MLLTLPSEVHQVPVRGIIYKWLKGFQPDHKALSLGKNCLGTKELHVFGSLKRENEENVWATVRSWLACVLPQH